MKKEKKRVNPVEVEQKYDYFIVKENDAVHLVYRDDYDKIIKILLEIDETRHKDSMIPAEVIANKLCDMRPELKTRMLRPTGKYYSFYHLVLKILDNQRYIDYYKDGTIIKHDKLVEISPVKRGLERWIPWLTK